MGSLKLFDVVKFSLLDANLMKVKDDYEGAFKPTQPGQTHPSGMGTVPGTVTQQQTGVKANGLLVRIAATHSGIITRNNGFYLPDRMKTGAASFTSNYPKPVLLHHADHQDPVGRIVAASYRDTSGAIADKYNGLIVKDKKGNTKGTISDTLIKDFVSGKMPFGMQVDTVASLLRDSVLEDHGYEGLGFIEIAADITNPEAVQKLLDGRYLTGSVGATTDAAVCSVCRQDWTETGQCEHKPGGIYDGAKCFIIAGNLVYDEYSFVNVPADRHSRVLELNYNGIQDKVQVDSQYSGRIYEVKLGFPQYDPKEEPGMKTQNTAEVKDSAAQPTTESQSAATTVVAAPPAAITPAAETPAPAAAAPADKVADATPAEGAAQAAAVTPSAAEATPAETPAAAEVVQDSKKTDDLLTKLLDDKREEGISDEEEEALYDMLWKELVAAVKDGEIVMEAKDLADAKLSTEKRKGLAKSTFCGPERSFPVPDCAHVTAARRLIGRYKGPGSKESILACVSRKAKAMGCGSSKDSKAKDNLNHTRMMHMVLGLLEQDLYYSQEATLSEEELDSLSKVLKRLSTMVMDDNFKKGLEKAGLTATVPAVVDNTKKHDEALLAEVAKLEETIGDLRDRLDANRKEYTSLYQDFESLQDSLVKEKKETRKVKESVLSTLRALRDHKVESHDLSAVSDSDLQTEIDQALKTVDMVKITDKLGDGMSRTPSGEVNSPVEVKDGTTNQKRTVDVKDLATIHETYVALRLSKGQSAAEAYLDSMKKQGKLPQE